MDRSRYQANERPTRREHYSTSRPGNSRTRDYPISGSRDYLGSTSSTYQDTRRRHDSYDRSSVKRGRSMEVTTPVKRKRADERTDSPKRPRKLKFHEDPNITEPESDHEDLTEKVKTLKQELRRKNLELSKLRKKSELKQKTIKKTEDLEKKNKTLMNEIETLKASATEDEDETRENLKKENSQLLKKIKDLNGTIEKKERDAKEASKERSSHSKKMTENMNKLKAELKKAEGDIKEKESTIKRIRNERDELKKNKKKMEELETALSNIKITTEAEKNEYEAAKKALDQKVRVLEHQIENLTVDDNILNTTQDESDEGGSEKDQAGNGTNKVETNLRTDNGEGKSKNASDEGRTESDEEIEDKNENTANKTFLVGSPDQFDSIIFKSDEEFPDSHCQISNYEIQNYENPKTSAAKDLKPPSKYHTSIFKPSVCTLNNKAVFVSTGATKLGNKYENAKCGLNPFCNIKWKKGDVIGRVFILETPCHPKNNDEAWVCQHHNQASLDGFELQTQKLVRRSNRGTLEKTKTVRRDEHNEDSNDANENQEPKAGTSNQMIEGVQPLPQRTKEKKRGNKKCQLIPNEKE